MTRRSILVVFFDGTSNTIDPPTTQIGIFAHGVEGNLVKSRSDVSSAMELSSGATFKMAFDGCGVTNGLCGALFASGLDGQVSEVMEVVVKLSEYGGVRVIAVGLSRGGIACFKLAKKIASKFCSQADKNVYVSTSLLLFDPVPGNSVWTGFPYTAAFSQNLSSCHNLERVLALYPYEPLPDIAMHAPTLATYPVTTKVEEDVTLGCHQGALYRTSIRPRNKYETASNLSFRRIYDFLDSENIEMKFSIGVFQPSAQECLSAYQLAIQSNHESKRIAHDKTGRNRTIIRRSSVGQKCRWLNRHHQELQALLSQSSRSSHCSTREIYQLDFDDGCVCTRNIF